MLIYPHPLLKRYKLLKHSLGDYLLVLSPRDQEKISWWVVGDEKKILGDNLPVQGENLFVPGDHLLVLSPGNQEKISWWGGGQKKLPGDNLPIQGEILLVSCRIDQEKISLYQEIISWFIHQETRRKSPGGVGGDKKITGR